MDVFSVSLFILTFFHSLFFCPSPSPSSLSLSVYVYLYSVCIYLSAYLSINLSGLSFYLPTYPTFLSPLQKDRYLHENVDVEIKEAQAAVQQYVETFRGAFVLFSNALALFFLSFFLPSFLFSYLIQLGANTS